MHMHTLLKHHPDYSLSLPWNPASIVKDVLHLASDRFTWCMGGGPIPHLHHSLNPWSINRFFLNSHAMLLPHHQLYNRTRKQRNTMRVLVSLPSSKWHNILPLSPLPSIHIYPSMMTIEQLHQAAVTQPWPVGWEVCESVYMCVL